MEGKVKFNLIEWKEDIKRKFSLNLIERKEDIKKGLLNINFIIGRNF